MATLNEDESVTFAHAEDLLEGFLDILVLMITRLALPTLFQTHDSPSRPRPQPPRPCGPHTAYATIKTPSVGHRGTNLVTTSVLAQACLGRGEKWGPVLRYGVRARTAPVPGAHCDDRVTQCHRCRLRHHAYLPGLEPSWTDMEEVCALGMHLASAPSYRGVASIDSGFSQSRPRAWAGSST